MAPFQLEGARSVRRHLATRASEKKNIVLADGGGWFLGTAGDDPCTSIETSVCDSVYKMVVPTRTVGWSLVRNSNLSFLFSEFVSNKKQKRVYVVNRVIASQDLENVISLKPSPIDGALGYMCRQEICREEEVSCFERCLVRGSVGPSPRNDSVLLIKLVSFFTSKYNWEEPLCYGEQIIDNGAKRTLWWIMQTLCLLRCRQDGSFRPGRQKSSTNWQNTSLPTV